MLTPEEKAFHDALVEIAEKFGPFDQGSGSIWVGYVPPAENEDAAIGVKCHNCSFYQEGGNCIILSYKVEHEAKCRLAAIPDDLVKPKSKDVEGIKMSFWGGTFDNSFAKRDYSTVSRRRMAESGAAMPDGSFPIANETDLRNAIQSVGRASNYEAARRHIIRRARTLGLTSLLPEDWK